MRKRNNKEEGNTNSANQRKATASAESEPYVLAVSEPLLLDRLLNKYKKRREDVEKPRTTIKNDDNLAKEEDWRRIEGRGRDTYDLKRPSNKQNFSTSSKKNASQYHDLIAISKGKSKRTQC